MVFSATRIYKPIIGPRTKRHLDDAIIALNVQFTAEDLDRIDDVAPPGRAVVPYYDYGYDGMAWVTWGPHKYGC